MSGSPPDTPPRVEEHPAVEGHRAVEGHHAVDGHRAVTLAIVALVSLIAFEALAVATAMPVVADALGGLRSYGLAFSLFLTTTMLGTVLAGSWCDSHGPRWTVLSGLVLFAGGLLLCGLAQTFGALLAGRVVSGVGAGFLVVSLYVVVAAVYPEAWRPKVFGWVSAAWVVPSMVGPVLAGWLATEVSWRWVFLLVPPFVLVVGAVLLPRVWGVAATPDSAATPGATGRRALAGAGLAAGATALQWGSQHLDPPSGWSLAAVVAGVVLVGACLPGLLPGGTLRARRGLPAVIAVRGLFAACFFGAETFVPLMLVAERGLSPTLAGLALIGGAVGWAAGAWVQGRPGLPVARSTLLSGGALLVTAAVACLPLAVLDAVPPMVVLPVWLLAGLGMGMAMSSTSVLTLSLSAAGERGRSSAALQVSDALGSVVGIGLAGALFAAMHQRAGQDGPVFVLIWLLLAVVGVLAVLVGQRSRPPVPLAAGSATPAACG